MEAHPAYQAWHLAVAVSNLAEAVLCPTLAAAGCQKHWGAALLGESPAAFPLGSLPLALDTLAVA